MPLPLVWTAAVGGARRWDAGVPHVTACFHLDSSGRAGQRGSIRPHTQPNALSTKAKVCINKQQTVKGDTTTHVTGLYFFPVIHQYGLKPSISPVCILVSRSEPLQIRAHLQHADVSPSDHEFHFPLSLFPTDRREEMKTEINTSSIDKHYFNTEQIKAPAIIFHVNITEEILFFV